MSLPVFSGVVKRKKGGTTGTLSLLHARKMQPPRDNVKHTMAVDTHNLNAAFRQACDDNQLLRAQLQASEWKLMESTRRHNQHNQDLYLNALMDKRDAQEELERERRRLAGKAAAEEKLWIARVDKFEALCTAKNSAIQALEKKLSSKDDELTREQGRHLIAAANYESAQIELEHARTEMITAREDLTELQRLDVEEDERRKMGLPPAYGSLDDEDYETPPWEKHCEDNGQLDRGHGMMQIETAVETHFLHHLRKAQGTANRMRRSHDTAQIDNAGPEFFRLASAALAYACKSLVMGVEHVEQLEPAVSRPPPTSTSASTHAKAHHSSSSSTSSTSKKRRLSIPPGEEKHKSAKMQSHSISSTVPFAQNSAPEAQHAKLKSKLPWLVPAARHNLANRAVNAMFHLLWQTLSAFELRPMSVVVEPSLRGKIGYHWRMIDDSLLKAVAAAAMLPHAASEGKLCTGCDSSSTRCAGSCVKLGRIQGYATQLTALISAFSELTPRGPKDSGMWGYLSKVSETVEDMVVIERRCAVVSDSVASPQTAAFTRAMERAIQMDIEVAGERRTSTELLSSFDEILPAGGRTQTYSAAVDLPREYLTPSPPGYDPSNDEGRNISDLSPEMALSADWNPRGFLLPPPPPPGSWSERYGLNRMPPVPPGLPPTPGGIEGSQMHGERYGSRTLPPLAQPLHAPRHADRVDAALRRLPARDVPHATPPRILRREGIDATVGRRAPAPAPPFYHEITALPAGISRALPRVYGEGSEYARGANEELAPWEVQAARLGRPFPRSAYRMHGGASVWMGASAVRREGWTM